MKKQSRQTARSAVQCDKLHKIPSFRNNHNIPEQSDYSPKEPNPTPVLERMPQMYVDNFKTNQQGETTMKFFELLRISIFAILIFAMVSVSAAELDTRDDIRNDPVPKLETETPSEPLPKISEDTIPAEPIEYVRYPMTEQERTIVEAVVAAESMGEDFDGQCLVAQCILNTAEATGKRPDEVVLEPGQYADPNYDCSHLVEDAVSAVFDDGYTVTSEPIRFFYAPAWGTSKWHETKLEFVLEHGGHRFFKTK